MSVAARAPDIKPVPPGVCPVCCGRGRIDDIPCEACDYTGRVTVVESYHFDDPLAAAPPARICAAYVRGELIAEARGPAADFVRSVVRTFEDTTESVAVYEGEQIVAVVRQEAEGLVATWL